MFGALANLAGMRANGYALIDKAFHFDTRKSEPVSNPVKMCVAELVLEQAPPRKFDASEILEAISAKNLPFSAAVVSMLVKEAAAMHLLASASIASRKIHSDLEQDTGDFFTHVLSTDEWTGDFAPVTSFGGLTLPQVSFILSPLCPLFPILGSGFSRP
jgi:hypothetical protein